MGFDSNTELDWPAGSKKGARIYVASILQYREAAGRPYAAASVLRRNPKIRAAIEAGLKELQLSRQEIIRAAERILEANPKELFDETGGFNIAKLGADMAQGSKAASADGNGGKAAIGVDDALVGLAAGVFGNRNGNGSASGNGKAD
jgi:hypothetical protein